MAVKTMTKAEMEERIRALEQELSTEVQTAMSKICVEARTLTRLPKTPAYAKKRAMSERILGDLVTKLDKAIAGGC